MQVSQGLKVGDFLFFLYLLLDLDVEGVLLGYQSVLEAAENVLLVGEAAETQVV